MSRIGNDLEKRGMKKSYFNKALLLFEVFRKHRIDHDTLVKAENKSTYLDGKADEFRLLIAMGKDVAAGRYHMDKWSLSIIIATIVYIVSPLDAIPDIVPIMGWVDDATIVAYAVSKLSDEIQKYKAYTQAKTSQTSLK